MACPKRPCPHGNPCSRTMKFKPSSLTLVARFTLWQINRRPLPVARADDTTPWCFIQVQASDQAIPKINSYRDKTCYQLYCRP